VGLEGEAVALELRAQLAVVVDAPVEDDGQAEILVDHRLRAALGEVDDRQPPVGQADAAVHPLARAIGPPRRERRAHARERVAVRRRVAAQLSGDPAH
jgi:hypothetical protein